MKGNIEQKHIDIEYTSLRNLKNIREPIEFKLMFQSFGFSKYFKNKKEGTDEFNILFKENINIEDNPIFKKSFRKKRNKESPIESEFKECLNLLISGGTDDIDSEESV